MPLFTSYLASARLLHLIVGALLAVLVFTQPSGGTAAGPFYALQLGLFVVLLGLFYANVHWAVPQLLYRQRLVLYLAFVAGAVLSVGVVHKRVQQQLRRIETARPPRFRAPGPAAGQRPGPPRGGPDGGWVSPAALLAAALVLGLGTSVAAVQRGQRETALRQALEQEKLLTELSWLKAQINPHFFFNTLNNIYSLTLLDGSQAREAIHRLSRMMRYVLYENQNATTTLSQEVQFVRDYLDLMQLRLTDNVTVEFTLPQPLHEVAIAPMLLLTFIENAFKHGVSTEAPSRIRIALRQPTAHTLEVLVENSVFVDRPVALDENSGIGLTNTRRRLALLYPDRHTLTITELTPAHEYRVHLSLEV
ncbi:sensor histidine kinase [Hymenobacter yonginensis]|uniref:Histidine kinase n=1 Tax=Hymenobacter yonginensis TaxID=748197 RepID=A0ABY7PP73_9BACT|nr:histidine kinase [Hymenobacter yonginensis]WBO84874.1 histidine kinase [Hymenobacter yonginensis]